MARKLQTFKEYVSTEGVPFSESALRWMAFNRENNGLAEAGAIVRIGRRVFIDPEAFDRWIDAQQPRRAVA